MAGLSAIVLGTGCYIVSVIQGAEHSAALAARLSIQENAHDTA